MNKNTKAFFLIALLAIIYFGGKLYRPLSPHQFVQEIREKAKPGFDSLNEYFYEQDYIHFRIDSLISTNSYAEALTVIENANIPASSKLDYKGQVELKKGNIRESLIYFDSALDLSNEIYSANRARAYVKLKMFDSALNDYKGIAVINYNFDKQIGEIYETLNQNDSALKYYELYFKQYPDSVSVKNRIIALREKS